MFLQRLGIQVAALIRLPIIQKKKKRRDEKKDNAEDRLKLNVKSFLMRTLAESRSVIEVRTKKEAPKVNP